MYAEIHEAHVYASKSLHSLHNWAHSTHNSLFITITDIHIVAQQLLPSLPRYLPHHQSSQLCLLYIAPKSSHRNYVCNFNRSILALPSGNENRYNVFIAWHWLAPRWFCPWTFFENIGFNTVLTDPFMSHLATQLGYSAGEFQNLQLIVLAAFGVED